MLNNSGKKIKFVSRLVFGINIAIELIAAIILYNPLVEIAQYRFEDPDTVVVLALLVLLAISIFAAWCVMIFVFGYGELIEDTRVIRIMLQNGDYQKAANSDYDSNNQEDIVLPPL